MVRQSKTHNTSGRVTARELLTVLKRSGEPMGWHELVAHFAIRGTKKDLRLLLKGLERTGEIRLDRKGSYHLTIESGGDVDLLEGSARQLTFRGLPVERGRRFRLRPGDKVAARIQGDNVRVLKVIEYSPTPLVGELRHHSHYPYVESLSPDYKGRISLIEAPLDGQDGDTVLVTVVGEDRRGLTGIVSEIVSTARGAAHAAETFLASYRVPVTWRDGVTNAAARLPKRVQAGRYSDRRQLEDLPLVTIDGETARDFDDVVFAEKSGRGWRLVVAIADVAHYVKPGGALDLEAWERGNSVYLPDRVVPMLPETLSNHLCSLRPHEARLAMVCDMRVSAAGKVTSCEFYEAVIRSWERLTYTRVNEFLTTGSLDVDVAVLRSLTELHKLYETFTRARDERGGLDFDTHEAELELAEDQVVAIHPVTRNDAHRLIEEAMIAANVCAARFLEKADAQGLYRVHEPPKGEKRDQLRQAFAFAGVRISRGELTPVIIRDALAALGERPDAWIFEMLVLRSMNQALYTPVNKGHFGLALPTYMHFTSPIRRYADLVVHRAIKHIIRGEPTSMSDDWLIATGEQISMTERRADEVGWGVDGWLKCEYISSRVGQDFAGVVVSVTEFGLFVELSGFYVQGLIHISELGTDYFQYRPQAMSLVGERSGRSFSMGDELQVKLIDVQPSLGRINLELVRAGRDTRKRRGSRTPKRRRR
ncbi:MAG: ribonuclease R [Gammaproteobacteria bacterium]|nr:ribonuclease R [Gammaproteobacteria bacterium]